MSQVRAVVKMRFAAGSIDDVVATVTPLVTKASEQEPGVLDLSYFADSSAGSLVVFERYSDASAMLEHVMGMDPELTSRLAGLTSIESVWIFGAVSEELRSVLSGFGEVSYFADLIGT